MFSRCEHNFAEIYHAREHDCGLSIAASPSQIIGRFGKSRYINFDMHLDIRYVKIYVSRFAETTYNLEQRKYNSAMCFKICFHTSIFFQRQNRWWVCSLYRCYITRIACCLTSSILCTAVHVHCPFSISDPHSVVNSTNSRYWRSYHNSGKFDLTDMT